MTQLKAMINNARHDINDCAIIIFIFVLAFGARIYKLGLMPINHDEAAWSLSFAQRYSWPVFIQPFEGPVFLSLVLLAKKMFYSIVAIVRLPAVIAGSLTVVLIYKLAEKMYGKLTGLVSALLLCFLPWHIIQSRLGYSVILVPFFGCFIFYALLKSILKRNELWFLLSCFLLGTGSFYTYQSAVLFVFLFFLIVFLERRAMNLFGANTRLAGVLILIACLSPVIFMQIAGKMNFVKDFYRSGSSVMFDGNIFYNLFIGFRNNAQSALNSLFFAKRQSQFLYGEALSAPLLLNPVVLFIFLLSVIHSIWRRNTADKIILAWVSLGWIVFLSAPYFDARYIIIILPAFIIFTGKFIAEMLKFEGNKRITKGIKAVSAVLCLGLISSGIWQMYNYYRHAPTDFEECRKNSFGCAEAARYLSEMPDLKNYRIIIDNRMTVDAYLTYYLKEGNDFYRGNDLNKKAVYYVVWAPESHPESYWGGLFSELYTLMKERYPNVMPVKVIYYSDGQPAIKIFKIA